MPRILLLVPTATYRAESFVRAAQRIDADITIASERPGSMDKFHPIDLITLRFSDPGACARKMSTFAAKHPVDAVVGVDDQVTLAAAAVGAALRLPHNPPDAAYATRNKLALRRRLRDAGVPQPRFRTLRLDEEFGRAAGDLGYPCVVKPLMMAASRGVIRCDTADDVSDAVRRIQAIVNAPDAPKDEESRQLALVEEYVSGWEVAVEGILTDGALETLAIFDKPDPLEGPYFPETIYVTPSSLPDDVQRGIAVLTGRAASALGLRHGPIHAEVRGDGERMWFIEIASRSIGGYCSRVLHFEGELSLEDVIIRHALFPERPVPKRRPAPAGVMMLQAPRAGRFVETRGVDSARRLPNIDEIIVSAHPGERLTPLPEGFLYVGFIFARGKTTQVVDHALREAFKKLEFVIDAA